MPQADASHTMQVIWVQTHVAGECNSGTFLQLSLATDATSANEMPLRRDTKRQRIATVSAFITRQPSGSYNTTPLLLMYQPA